MIGFHQVFKAKVDSMQLDHLIVDIQEIPFSGLMMIQSTQ
jgi:hypothetical protein